MKPDSLLSTLAIPNINDFLFKNSTVVDLSMYLSQVFANPYVLHFLGFSSDQHNRKHVKSQVLLVTLDVSK